MKKKMNNKGFSLVELIVVVLIMAIIGVALAPQVIKWVNNARISADNNTYDALVSSTQLALADETLYGKIKDLNKTHNDKIITVTMSSTKSGTDYTTITCSNNDVKEAFVTALKAVLPDYASSQKKVSSGSDYSLSIRGDGSVVKDSAPDGEDALDK